MTIAARLLDFLNRLAGTRGRAMYGPEGGDVDALRRFQEEVDQIEELAGQGILNIIGEPHRESRTAHSFIDLIQIELTRKGKHWLAGAGEQHDTLGEPELGHVLFVDIVGYSKLPMDRQADALQVLQECVRATGEFQRAQAEGKLISLPTGDGMALVFFSRFDAHVRCAMELGRALKQHPELELRMGVNSGPVYRVVDINTNRNVSGGGINVAQRVMDCGDAGHILLSRAVADTLLQLGNWKERLQDLGEAEVKHGEKIHVFNLSDGEVGNPARLSKLKPAAAPAEAEGGRLEATINHVPVRAYEGYREHTLNVGLINNAPRTLDDYRIEIEVPNSVINQSTGYSTEVESRRSSQYRFFRSEGKDHSVKSLRPGDRDKTFWKIDLLLPPGAEESGALDEKIIISVFAGDERTQRNEMTVRELLAQPPNFG